jgi:threonine/homoserine/homoserine lactone efflux protein
MLGIHDLWLFVISGLVLSLAPGPDLAYVIARSAQFGWRGGAVATFGISTGCLVHVLPARSACRRCSRPRRLRSCS